MKECHCKVKLQQHCGNDHGLHSEMHSYNIYICICVYEGMYFPTWPAGTPATVEIDFFRGSQPL